MRPAHWYRLAMLVAGVLVVVGGPAFLFPEGRLHGQMNLVGGFGGAAPEAAPEPPPQEVYVIPKITEQTARTWLKLQQPIKMSFREETPLEDVLKYVKSATTDKESKGLPIYVDPIGLQEAEKTIISPVTIELEGIALAKTLRLTLKQLGLAYFVRHDGLVVITCQSGSDDPERTVRESMSNEVEELKEAIGALGLELNRIRVQGAVPNAAVRKTQLKAQPNLQEGVLAQLNGPTKPTEIRCPLSAAAARTWLQLQKQVNVSFKETSLVEALRSLRKETQRNEGTVQFFVDPLGLQMAEKTMESPVTLFIDGVTVAASLELILKQLGMRFSVEDDGLVVITNESPDPASSEDMDLNTLNSLSSLRREVQALRLEAAFLRRHQAATPQVPKSVIPASKVNPF